MWLCSVYNDNASCAVSWVFNYEGRGTEDFTPDDSDGGRATQKQKQKQKRLEIERGNFLDKVGSWCVLVLCM